MLKPKERALAELMCCEPSLKVIEYAQKCGISEKTVYLYKNKPEFQQFLDELCKKKFKSMESLALKKLREEVDSNNFKAIQYVLDSLGYKAKEEQEVSMDVSIEIDYGED